METVSLLTCRGCSNADYEDFDYVPANIEADEPIPIYAVICRNCKTVCDDKIALCDLSQASACRCEAAVALTTINDASALNVGDHVVMGRRLYMHHAIVTETLLSYSGKVRVVHFDGPNGKGQSKGIVKEEHIQVTGDGTPPLFRVDYLPGACRPAAETVLFARLHLDKSNYDLCCNNCEHLATYCKTGLHDSSQVNATVDLLWRTAERLLSTGASSLTKNVVNVILRRRAIATAAAAAAAAAANPSFEFSLDRWFRRRRAAPNLDVVNRVATKVGAAITVAAFAWEVWRFVEDVRDTTERRARGEPGGEVSVMGEVLVRRTCEVVGSAVGGVIVGALVPLPGTCYVGMFLGGIIGDSIGKMTGGRFDNAKDTAC